MGERTVEFLNALSLPARRSGRPGRRRAPALHGDGRGARRPGHRRRARRERRRRPPSGTRSRPSARGSGAAALLMHHAELRLSAWPLDRPRRADRGARRLHRRRRRPVGRRALAGRHLPLARPLPRDAGAGLARAAAGAAAAACSRPGSRWRRSPWCCDSPSSTSSSTSRSSSRLVALGFWFLTYFETVAWAVLVAAIIPWVDAISVWRGPTDYVVEEQPQLFDNVSIAFRLPGEDGTANLGPPDILFFALFLAAADRFGLRPVWTWLTMTALLGATLALAVADRCRRPARAPRDRGRLPARERGPDLARAAPARASAGADLREDGCELLRPRGRRDRARPAAVVVLTRDRPPVTGHGRAGPRGGLFPAMTAELPRRSSSAG